MVNHWRSFPTMAGCFDGPLYISTFSPKLPAIVVEAHFSGNPGNSPGKSQPLKGYEVDGLIPLGSWKINLNDILYPIICTFSCHWNCLGCKWTHQLDIFRPKRPMDARAKWGY